MPNGKAEGPDQIPVEVWKCLGEEGLEWLTELFNVIFRTAKMPKEWRVSTVIPLYKNKGDIQEYQVAQPHYEAMRESVVKGVWISEKMVISARTRLKRP